MPEPMLAVEGLETAYGQSQVLFGVSLRIARARSRRCWAATAWARPRPCARSWGWSPARRAASRFDGAAITSLPSYRIAQAGIGLVPEGRQIFPNLTVRENLVATAANRRAEKDPWTLERVYELFPQPARAGEATTATSSPAASSRCSRSAAR